MVGHVNGSRACAHARKPATGSEGYNFSKIHKLLLFQISKYWPDKSDLPLIPTPDPMSVYSCLTKPVTRNHFQLHTASFTVNNGDRNDFNTQYCDARVQPFSTLGQFWNADSATLGGGESGTRTCSPGNWSGSVPQSLVWVVYCRNCEKSFPKMTFLINP